MGDCSVMVILSGSFLFAICLLVQNSFIMVETLSEWPKYGYFATRISLFKSVSVMIYHHGANDFLALGILLGLDKNIQKACKSRIDHK